MNTSEWSLVVFTILAQMAVGSFLVLGVVHFTVSRKAGSVEADRMSDRALLAIGPVLVLGLIASFFHLGNPLNAYNALGNIGSSWLSREIAAGVGFAGLGAVFAFMQWRKIGSAGLRNAVALLAALVGVALVYSMANVYQLRTVEVWNTTLTTVSFFTTTLLLGTLAMGAAFVANYSYVQRKNPGCADMQCQLLRSVLSAIGITSIVLLGVDAADGRHGLRPDSINVASVDEQTGRTVLFGLPRNLQRVQFPASSPLQELYPRGYRCSDGECMLNGIYTLGHINADRYGDDVEDPGMQAMKEAISHTLELSINYYVMVDMAGFTDLVDAMGGIQVNVHKAVPIGGVTHPVTGHIGPGENLHLDGYEALWLARSRHGSSDYERMVRQKCVMNARAQQLDPQRHRRLPLPITTHTSTD